MLHTFAIMRQLVAVATLHTLVVGLPLLDLDSAIQSAEQGVTLHDDRTSHIDGLISDYQKLIDDSSNLGTLAERRGNLLEKLEGLIRQANVRQLDNFNKRLTDVLNAEATRRRRGNNAYSGEIESVSLEYLDGAFNLGEMVASSESELENWVHQVLDEEISALANLEIVTVDAASQDHDLVSDDDCVSRERAAQVVQEGLMSFMQDGIGLKDQAVGSAIIYELTSPTYQPPTIESDRLGHWGWRKLIPEDWEDVLPAGWQDWTLRLPSFAPNWVATAIGGRRQTALPQAIFHGDTRPGSCWPLDGQKGQIAFRLPRPINIEAFTIDHVSDSLLPGDADLSSAPGDISVFGFPPCSDAACEGLGFDKHARSLLKSVTFEIEGPSTQTFALQVPEPAREETVDDGTCTITSVECGAPNPFNVAAILLQIEDNWGNEDYTCLYRFRVHGEPI